MAEEKLSKAQKLYKKYLSKMEGLLSTMEANEVYEELAGGKNSYLKMSRLQTSAFDTTWIDKIEDVIFDLGDIIANPRMNTKSTADIIPVELARKVNAESVRHLASHTQFIKDIDEHGDVIPNKILNISYEDDLHTYENKFIATLVRKLVLFVEKRYEYIESVAPMFNETVLYYKNDSVVKGNEVSIETKIKVRTETEDMSRDRLKAYLDRILQIREYILYFYNSPFMKKLKTERNVRNPILQTNIIRKNLKYHHCYEVYKFIESYDSLGVDYKINEDYAALDDQDIKEINNVIMVNYLLSQAGKDTPKAKVCEKYYKPKILTSLDDESFVYGPLYEGPISFIRTDEGFREWFTNKVKKDLPLHPKKHEREFYREEFSVKKDIKEDITATESLLKRVNKNTERFNKIVERVIQEREEEARRIEEERLAAIKAEEEAQLNKIREAVKERARKDFPEKEVDEVDQIVDQILNEGYDPNDVEFIETLQETVNEQFKAEEEEPLEPERVEELYPEAKDENAEQPKVEEADKAAPAADAAQPVAEATPSGNATNVASNETVPAENAKEPEVVAAPVEEAPLEPQYTMEGSFNTNANGWISFPNPNAKPDLLMEDTPVEQLPSKPIAEVNQGASVAINNDGPVDNYDEDDGTGVWYIVRQFQGFYVKEGETTRKKEEAKIFKSEAAVRRFKLTHDGRVKRYQAEAVAIPTLQSKKKK